ncbi:uncharacterized protein LOC144745244 isoform X2 [Ciona intestinalis]
MLPPLDNEESDDDTIPVLSDNDPDHEDNNCSFMSSCSSPACSSVLSASADLRKRERRALSDSKIRENLKNIGGTVQPSALINIKPAENAEQLKELEASMEIKEKKYSLIAQLKLTGGVNERDCLHAIFKKLFSNRLMSRMNLNGTNERIAFINSNLYDIVLECVRESFPKFSDQEYKSHVGNFLKNAPSRKDGSISDESINLSQ